MDRERTMSYSTLAAAAALGAASSMHCITMCGPLVVAGCARGGKKSKSALAYLSGRFVSYAAIGGLAGGLGGALVVARETSREVRIAIGLFLAISVAIAGLRWLRRPGAPPFIRLRRAPKPSGLFVRIARFVPASGLGLGLATGFFPCGALASGLVVAAASGSAWSGSLAMLAFAAASAPALLLTALFGKGAAEWISSRARGARPAIGVALLGLAGWLAVSPFLGEKDEHAGCSCESTHVVEAAER